MTGVSTRVPWLTTLFVALAASLSASPAVSDALVYRRAAVEAGEVWRVFTAQWVHGSASMAFADLAVVALCGGFLERRHRGLALGAAVGGLLAVALAVHGTQAQVTHFDGSSGVAAALFVAAALWIALRSGSGRLRVLSILAVVGIFAKAALEQWAGWQLTGVGLPEGARVLPAAHLAGGVAGACGVAWIARGRGRERTRCASDPSPRIAAGAA